MLEAIKKVITKEVMKFYDSGPPSAPPSRLLYIPKRTYHKLYGPGIWEYGSTHPMGEFTIPLGYVALPPSDIKPLPPTHAKFISKSSFYEMMSNVYLYLGYVHHVLVNHSKKFLANKYDEILDEFNLFSKGQNVFTFKVPRSFIPNWSSCYAGMIAKRIKYYNNVNLSTATKLRVEQSNAHFFTDKAMTPEVLENVVFVSSVEINELDKHYTKLLYFNTVYQLIIEGCNEYKKIS
tara:strand:- start:540 stop:1244 length:705 start_codon:yes stop_codon:yes gene_type:complete